MHTELYRPVSRPMQDHFSYASLGRMVKKGLTKHTSAVGLRYNANSTSSPTISVKGEHFDADEIVRLAKRFGIPVVEKRELAKALKSLNLDENIPAQLFEAIAMVIVQVDKKIK